MPTPSFKLLRMALLLAILVVLCLNVRPVVGCGLPMSQPVVICGGGGGGCGGGYGGGCGGGCGRRKREAVQPVYKDRTVPCPQTEWREIIQQAIVSSATPNTDIDAPITMAVQSALNINFPHNKFMVICSPTGDDFGLIKENSVSEFPSKMQFSSGGDGYCNVKESNVWCQTVAMIG